MKWKIFLYSIGGLLGAWIITSLFLPPLREYLSLKKALVRVKDENKELKKEIVRLKKEKGEIKNDKSYLEYLIRKELMMTKPGEKIYRIR